jgi:hypothetical protein
LNPQTQADLGDAMQSAQSIDDTDLRKQSEMQVYLMGAFVNALDDLVKALRVK